MINGYMCLNFLDIKEEPQLILKRQESIINNNFHRKDNLLVKYENHI